MSRHAAAARRASTPGDPLPGGVVLVDVGLHVDLDAAPRRTRLRAQGKGLAPTLQQGEQVASDERGHSFYERGRERGVIRDASPDRAVVHVRATDAKAANVNAVEPEHRKHRRKTPRGKAAYQLEDFLHVERMRELVRGFVAPVPVVEVARDDERRVGRDDALDALAQALSSWRLRPRAVSAR